MDCQLASPEFHLGDPAPAYRALRHRSPVHRTDANGGFWAISRYEDVRWIGAPVPTRIIADLIELRETDRTNDLVSTLLDAEVDGETLARDELINFLRLLLLAGNENTRNLIALGTLALINHPAQRQQLIDDPGLIPTAVEEMLRWITPVTQMTRTPNPNLAFPGIELVREVVRVRSNMVPGVKRMHVRLSPAARQAASR
jgi:cytochrome P450